MKTNTAFRRALVSLSNPICIGAIVLLLFNDHVWRRVAPSWLTGKLGDFTWLIFAPFLLAAILAWLPKRIMRDEGAIGRTAIIGTGLAFALVKTDPTFHAGFAELFKGLMGWTPATLLDPTDLLALPALLIAWLIWQHSTTSFTFDSRRGWLILAMGAFATMANTAPVPNFGVVCLVEQDASVVAISYTGEAAQPFVSNDGGLTWNQEPSGAHVCPGLTPSYRAQRPLGTPLQIVDPAKPLVYYRFIRGHAIERSDDGGQTWHQEFDLSGDQARLLVLETNYALQPGPYDAVVHRSIGHVIVAMGLEGVLVRTGQGEWRWVSVGTYSVPDMRIDRVLQLLAGEVWLALVLAALAAGALARRTTEWRLIKTLLAIVMAASLIGMWTVWGALMLADHVDLIFALLIVATGLGLTFLSRQPDMTRRLWLGWGVWAVVAAALCIVISDQRASAFRGRGGMEYLLLEPVLIGLSIGIARLSRRIPWMQVLPSAILIVTWSGWIYAVVGLTPAVSRPSFFDPEEPAYILLTLLAAPTAILLVKGVHDQYPRVVVPILIVATVTMLLFITPFMLWAQGAIAFYPSATLYAMLLAAAALTGGFLYVRRRFNATARPIIATDQTLTNESGGAA